MLQHTFLLTWRKYVHNPNVWGLACNGSRGIQDLFSDLPSNPTVNFQLWPMAAQWPSRRHHQSTVKRTYIASAMHYSPVRSTSLVGVQYQWDAQWFETNGNNTTALIVKSLILETIEGWISQKLDISKIYFKHIYLMQCHWNENFHCSLYHKCNIDRYQKCFR